jgi:hypothetical protein
VAARNGGHAGARIVVDQPSQSERRPWWHVEPPPWWIIIIALIADAGTGVWRVISAGGGGGAGLFLSSLLWPGIAIAGAVFLVCWMGWSLDLE